MRQAARGAHLRASEVRGTLRSVLRVAFGALQKHVETEGF